VQVRGKQIIDKYLGYFLIGVLLPFTRLLGITMRRDHSLSRPPGRILFVKLMGLGSLVAASDVIAGMKARLPETQFVLLTDDNLAEGIAPFRVFDKIYRLPTSRLGPCFVRLLGFLPQCWTWRRLWVIDLEVYSKLTTVLALLTGARNRLGFYLSPVPFRKYLNTHNIPFDQSACLSDNYYFMACQALGADNLELPLPEPRTDEYHRPYIFVNNTCSTLAYVRKLPERSFSTVCRWVLESTHYGLAILGGPGDGEDISRFIGNDPVLAENKRRVVNVAAMNLSFEEYYCLLREMGVCLVTIDSGPLHIAKRLGLPTVSVWGPTDPRNYLKAAPDEEGRHLSIYLGHSCSPCVHRKEQLPCGGNNTCMKEIEAVVIINKIEELLIGVKYKSLLHDPYRTNRLYMHN
jgi:ADP-heptose:LPS heptosyltransferase